MRKIFGPKREWIRLHNEELYDVFLTKYYSRDKIKRHEMSGACVGDRRGVYRVMVGRPEGKRPFVRPRYRWEDNIKVFKKWDGKTDWIDLSQDGDMWQAFVNEIMNLQVP